jgi:hypothetical protein
MARKTTEKRGKKGTQTSFPFRKQVCVPFFPVFERHVEDRRGSMTPPALADKAPQ